MRLLSFHCAGVSLRGLPGGIFLKAFKVYGGSRGLMGWVFGLHSNADFRVSMKVFNLSEGWVWGRMTRWVTYGAYRVEGKGGGS